MRAVFLVLTKLYGVWINRFIMAGRVVERGELPFLYLMAESLISLLLEIKELLHMISVVDRAGLGTGTDFP